MNSVITLRCAICFVIGLFFLFRSQRNVCIKTRTPHNKAHLMSHFFYLVCFIQVESSGERILFLVVSSRSCTRVNLISKWLLEILKYAPQCMIAPILRKQLKRYMCLYFLVCLLAMLLNYNKHMFWKKY